ncbi:lysylphosphatidylglycerol synthase transmembrane domain-containing protein [Methanoregula sp.]|uniref:lysylphosphatidylglycerol synthase transmembrane domain-containing protein n=1 Tax=Methanoregula sp. TaxID=2052170 RepID=UPI002C00D1B3|nr:lysylphosphatidylglycerol synthase transmembrane domain-containing protein [Methanoregula sp.]HVP95681.1 lysylphosphatidylglycerol synthase transmembrane domain-containing protein [Methanoregula sp.]
MEFTKNHQKLLQILLFCIGFLILGYVISVSGIIQNYQVLFKVNIPLLFLALCLSLCTIAFRIVRWKFLSQKYDTEITWHDAALVSVASLFYANITPGKVGDLYKAYYMQRRYSLNIFNGISMIFYERFFELMILFLAAFAIVFIQLKGITVIILEVTAIILVLLFLFYYKADYFLKVLEKHKSKLPVLNKIPDGFEIKKLPFPDILRVFVITGCSLSCDFLTLFVVALAFGYTLNPLILTIFFCLSIIAGLVSQIPLGVGVMEGSLGYLLLFLGVAASDSMAIVLIDRMLSMYLVLILGFICSKYTTDQCLGVTT